MVGEGWDRGYIRVEAKGDGRKGEGTGKGGAEGGIREGFAVSSTFGPHSSFQRVYC
jgi:hypothetical protein